MLKREERWGCSVDWPARNLEAEGVRITRIEREGWAEREQRIWGSLMVATEPEQARRRWDFESVAWSEARKRGVDEDAMG